MLVFIDESGCPGLKLQAGSTPYFTVALVVFEDPDEALRAEAKISDLRRQFGFPAHFEFHFNNLRPDYREAFLRAVSGVEFFYLAITINKAALLRENFRDADSLYKYACGLVFETAKPYLDNAIVVMDGSGSRAFRRQLSSYLRKRVNGPEGASRFIRKVKLQDSDKNNLIQMADMVCSSIARFHSGKKDAELYRSLISHREIAASVWPR